MKRLLVVSVCLFGAACAPPPVRRGEFTLIATKAPGSGVTIVSTIPVEGSACFNLLKAQFAADDDVFENAVRDALQRAPGANVLIDATFVDKGECVHVRGMPARM